MPETVTMMDVYKIYKLYQTYFSFLSKFGDFGSTLFGNNFLAKVEAVGRAYCEENNLPFPDNHKNIFSIKPRKIPDTRIITYKVRLTANKAILQFFGSFINIII